MAYAALSTLKLGLVADSHSWHGSNLRRQGRPAVTRSCRLNPCYCRT